MTSPPSLPVLRQLLGRYRLAERNRPGRDPWDLTVAGLKLARASSDHLPALLDLVERQAAAIEAVQELHRRVRTVKDLDRWLCESCAAAWPCPTALALPSGITPTTEETKTNER